MSTFSLQKSRKQQYLRQSVQITGLNTPVFQTCIDSLHQMHDLLGRSLPENSLEQFRPDTFGTYFALNLATRYFTSRHDDPFSSALPFPYSNLKQNGGSALMLNNNYFYGYDNQVLYYAAVPTPQTGASSK